METYGMVTKKYYQKYLLVLFYHPLEWVLRQYTNMSNFLIFCVFQMFLTKKFLKVIKASFHRLWLIYICTVKI